MKAWWSLLLAACWTSSSTPPPAKPTTPPSAEPSVLSRIESYEPPPVPADATGAEAIADTYEARRASDGENPPTLTDTLLCDLLQRLTLDFKREITPAAVTEDEIVEAIAVYTQREWIHIAGFRPRAHAFFIRSLTDKERALLAKQSVARIHEQEPVCPD
jgi:hypothetical protein